MVDPTEGTDRGDRFVNPAELHLDLSNPRVTESDFVDEDAVLEYLIDHVDIDELIQSILGSGWLDYEPLIVLEGTNVVLEGNRRLAALRILSDHGLRERLKIDIPSKPSLDSLPQQIRVHHVKSREEARSFIGFKHINGPYKWDALAKAKYAVEWLDDGEDIKQISRRLGDNHNTVIRLVNGWRVLSQSYTTGFDRSETTKKSFPFSHLYTALARPNVRRYLQLPETDRSEVLTRNPVPSDATQNLRRLMSWLYGQKDEPSVITSQNPDLNHLVEVLGHETARTMLEARRDLNTAYSEVEDKTLKFGHSLMLTIAQAEETLKLVGNFDRRADLMIAVDNLRRTILSLHGAMKAEIERAEEGDTGDADQ